MLVACVYKYTNMHSFAPLNIYCRVYIEEWDGGPTSTWLAFFTTSFIEPMVYIYVSGKVITAYLSGTFGVAGELQAHGI